MKGASTSTHCLPPKVLHPLGKLEPLAWTRAKSTSNPLLHCAFPETHDASLVLAYAAKALP